jgi:hypothetical protein
LKVDQPSTYSPNFRFTITLDGPESVEAAHQWLARSGGEAGMTDLRDVETGEAGTGFCLRDMDGNWWEIAAGR